MLRRGRTDVKAKKPNPPQYRGRLIKDSWKLRGDAVPENPIELAKRYRAVALGPEQWTLSGNKKSGWKAVKKDSKTIVAWIGRQKRPGKQYPSSKLRFDIIEGE